MGLKVRVRPRELADLYERALSLGCEVRRHRTHMVLSTPSGQQVYGPITGGDSRTTLNTRAALRRARVAV